MTEYIEFYWKKRIETCKTALQINNFDVFLAEDPADASKLILNEIFPTIPVRSVSWGDSMSLHATKVLEKIEANQDIEIIKTFEPGVPRDEIMERRRQALLVDVFLTGSNALTESGKLVNLDMVGNRVAGITFGPKYVIITVGRNKIVAEFEEAVHRIKNYAAPLNAIRHTGFKTPCATTSYCSDCKSPDRICNVWTITEKSYPKGRIKVVIINRDLGL
jgi:L-lactate utilization protein LutB